MRKEDSLGITKICLRISDSQLWDKLSEERELWSVGVN
jgi:hypothetical protein